MSSEVASWSLLAAIKALKEGRLSAKEYQCELTAHERQHGDFSCYITRTEEQHTKSTGLLSDIPIAVKDNIDVAGVPTTAATPKLRDHVPIRSADVWQRLSEAGACLSVVVNKN
ncbi:amidase family protein [Serratia sp. NPDC078593]|uniref:amidase family protein n=1 Tax=unclassified Serratia (in: enterobacteria) TaxID=2647522 RepID=UPI0037D59173